MGGRAGRLAAKLGGQNFVVAEPDVEHRPVYGSTEKDEYLCSCGWRGTTLQLREHYETAAEESGRRIEAFVRLLDDSGAIDSWEAVASLEADPAYLSPGELRCALANRRFAERPSDAL